MSRKARLSAVVSATAITADVYWAGVERVAFERGDDATQAVDVADLRRAHGSAEER